MERKGWGVHLALSAAVSLLACRGELSGEGPIPDAGVSDAGHDSGPASDSEAQPDGIETPDSPAEAGGDGGGSACNATNCGGACCGDTCVSRTCNGCAVGTIFCPSSTVSDSPGYCTASCSACQPEGTSSGATVTCFNCFFGAPAGSCALTADQCPQTLHGAACSCLDGGGCPGATQTCEHDDAGAPVCISH